MAEHRTVTIAAAGVYRPGMNGVVAEPPAALLGRVRPERVAAALLVALAALMLGLWLATVSHFVHPPAGYSPRLGGELDVTGFFPPLWTFTSPSLTPAQFSVRAWGLFSGLAACYAVALLLLGSTQLRRSPSALWIVGGAAVAAHVVLLFAPPFLSNDLFHYAVFGRGVAHGGTNPYTHPIGSMTSDPLMPFATWPGSTSHFGASFTWLSALVARFAGDSVFGTALAFKGWMVACNLLTCWMIPRVTRALHGDGTWALAIYAWNPVVLLELAVMGHNDALMITLAMAGLLLYLSGKPWWAFLALVLSADVKQVTAALGALVALHFIFSLPDWRGRGKRALQLVALAVAVEGSLWWPFWAGRRTFSGSHEILFDLAQKQQSAQVPPATWVSIGIFLGLVLLAAVLATRSRIERIVDMAAFLMLVFAFFVFPWKLPWYLLAALALSAVNYRSGPSRLVLVTAVVRSALLAGLFYCHVHAL